MRTLYGACVASRRALRRIVLALLGAAAFAAMPLAGAKTTVSTVQAPSITTRALDAPASIAQSASASPQWNPAPASAAAASAAAVTPVRRADQVDGSAAPTSSEAAQVARGRYLATLADCAACHTDPATRQPFSGGSPLNSPFGKIYASNITPDRDTGIGRYSLQDFSRALREGVAPGGKNLYPAMPYASFAKISDQDIAALYAFFMRGVAPVSHRPPPTRLPFPFNQRWGLFFWRKLFANHERFEPDSARGAEWNRGAYLVQGLGHCGACHTPRGPVFEERGYDESSAHYLTGFTNDNWYAPNLRGAANAGLGRWSEQDIVSFLKTGRGHETVAYGAMGPAVEESLQYLSDTDAHAIARYLKSLPARADSGDYAPRKPTRDGVAHGVQGSVPELPGAGLYANFCARCHQADGGGVSGRYPRLAGSSMVLGPDASSMVRLVLEGGHSPKIDGGPPMVAMPAFGAQLDDGQIAAVLSFVRNSWGNRAAGVTPRTVRKMRQALAKP